MTQPTPRPRRSRVAQVLSTILFIAAIAFAAAAIYLWYTDDDPDEPGPPPTAVAGDAELANVLAVLEEQDSAWEYGRITARSDQFPSTIPGQSLTLGDINLFVFIFNSESGEDGIAAREEAATSANVDTMEISTPSGQVLSGGETLHMAQASNVITILVSDDQELADEVDSALANLP